MKEVNKLTKIYKGFFGDELPEDLAKERRDICATCPFNSTNAEKLSLMEGIRNSFTPPFCTLCKCQIHEKTGSALEECAMYMKGEEKKWYKIKVETMGKENLNLIQVGDTKYDIGLEGDYFVINLGEQERSSVAEVDVVFESKKPHKLNFQKVALKCGCTASKEEVIDEYSVQVSLKVDMKNMAFGASSRVVDFVYSLDNGANRVQKVKFKFFRK